MRFGQLAEPRRFIDRATNNGVLKSFVSTDIPRHNLTCGDANTGRALRNLAGQPVDDAPGRRERFVFGQVQRHWRPEYSQGRIAFELIQKAAVAVDLLHNNREKAIEKLHNVNRR